MHIGINESNALRLLADAFSGRTTFVTELMQNARRAGATQIDFKLPSPGVLEINDDGCGIDDFSRLLTLCESGWSADVQAADAPYGVGFFSAIMASRAFSVSSRGKVLVAETDKLLAREPALIEDGEAHPGTRISLALKTTPNLLGEAVSQAAYTFPITVTFNGAVLDNDLSVTKAPYQIDVPGLGTLVWDGLGESDTYAFALQGLPINVDGHHIYSHCKNAYNWVIHLDPAIYKGRMPDREKVIGFDAAQAANLLKQSYQTSLVLRALVCSNGHPSSNVWSLCLSHGLHTELERLVLSIPGGVFRQCSMVESVALEYAEKSLWRYGHRVSKSESNDLIFAHLPDEPDDGEDIAILRVLAAHEVLLCDGWLPSWIKRIVYDALVVTPNGVHDTYTLSLPTGCQDVICCDSVNLELVDKDGGVVLAIEEETEYDPNIDGMLYCIGNAGNTSVDWSAFTQDYACVDDNNASRWDDELISHCIACFASELTLARSGDPSSIVVAAVNGIVRRELQGRTYVVTFRAMDAVVCEAVALGAIDFDRLRRVASEV